MARALRENIVNGVLVKAYIEKECGTGYIHRVPVRLTHLKCHDILIQDILAKIFRDPTLCPTIALEGIHKFLMY